MANFELIIQQESRKTIYWLNDGTQGGTVEESTQSAVCIRNALSVVDGEAAAAGSHLDVVFLPERLQSGPKGQT